MTSSKREYGRANLTFGYRSARRKGQAKSRSKMRPGQQWIEDEIHGLATMVADGFDDLAKRLDVRERVDSLEKKMTKVESALNVRL